jgi:hypothetical protein
MAVEAGLVNLNEHVDMNLKLVNESIAQFHSQHAALLHGNTSHGDTSNPGAMVNETTDVCTIHVMHLVKVEFAKLEREVLQAVFKSAYQGGNSTVVGPGAHRRLAGSGGGNTGAVTTVSADAKIHLLELDSILKLITGPLTKAVHFYEAGNGSCTTPYGVTALQWDAVVNGLGSMLVSSQANQKVWYLLTKGNATKQVLLNAAVKADDTLVTNLKFGDIGTNMPTPPEQAMVTQIATLGQSWANFKAALMGTDASAVASTSKALLDLASATLTQYTAIPSTNKSVMKLSRMEQSIRQMMLVQKAASQAFDIGINNHRRLSDMQSSARRLVATATMDELTQTIKQFESSHQTLLEKESKNEGNGELRQDVITQMSKLYSTWRELKPNLMSVAAGSVDDASLFAVDSAVDALTAELQKAANLYATVVYVAPTDPPAPPPDWVSPVMIVIRVMLCIVPVSAGIIKGIQK